MKNIALLSLLLSISLPSWAASWVGPAKVEFIRAYPATSSSDANSHKHFIKLNMANPTSGCYLTTHQGLYELNDKNARAYSILLAALTSNKDVRLNIEGCTNSPAKKIIEVEIVNSAP